MTFSRSSSHATVRTIFPKTGKIDRGSAGQNQKFVISSHRLRKFADHKHFRIAAFLASDSFHNAGLSPAGWDSHEKKHESMKHDA
jgi:hypothetical protein